MKTLTIGQLAKKTGLTTVTIRYYERCGLLPKLERSQGGYRLYPESIIGRLNFIHNAKSVDFDLKEIKSLIDLQDSTASSQAIKERTQQKIHEIQLKISVLQKMEATLTQLDKSCDGKSLMSQCPILKGLHKQPKK